DWSSDVCSSDLSSPSATSSPDSPAPPPAAAADRGPAPSPRRRVMHTSRPRRRSARLAAPSRRQLLGAGLLTAGVPVLSSCFGLGDTSGLVLEQPGGETPPEFEGRQRVVLWSSFTAHNAEVIQANIDAFHQEQDEIYCEVQIFEGYDGVESKLAASLQAQQVPDIAVLSDVSWNRFYL